MENSEIMKYLFMFFTTILWIDLILCFFSKSFNEMMIKELEELNKKIENRKKVIKKLLRKFFDK